MFWKHNRDGAESVDDGIGSGARLWWMLTLASMKPTQFNKEKKLNYQLFHKLKRWLLNRFCLFTEPSFPFSLGLEMWSERRYCNFVNKISEKKKKNCLELWFKNIKHKLKNSDVILQNLLFISYHTKLKNSVVILVEIFVELIFRICWTYFQFISQPLMFLIF
jgi:hypothetical protein